MEIRDSYARGIGGGRGTVSSSPIIAGGLFASLPSRVVASRSKGDDVVVTGTTIVPLGADGGAARTTISRIGVTTTNGYADSFSDTEHLSGSGDDGLCPVLKTVDEGALRRNFVACVLVFCRVTYMLRLRS